MGPDGGCGVVVVGQWADGCFLCLYFLLFANTRTSIADRGVSLFLWPVHGDGEIGHVTESSELLLR